MRRCQVLAKKDGVNRLCMFVSPRSPQWLLLLLPKSPFVVLWGSLEQGLIFSPMHHLREQFRAEQCCEQSQVWWLEGHLLLFWGFLSTKATEMLRCPVSEASVPGRASHCVRAQGSAMFRAKVKVTSGEDHVWNC